MAGITPVDFVADQLRAAAPAGTQWVIGGIDRARELATILVNAGIVDITRLRLESFSKTFTVPKDESIGVYSDMTYTMPGLRARYDGRVYELIGSVGQLLDDADIPLYVWSAEGHGHVDYNVKVGAQGFYFKPDWASSSDWGTFHDAIKAVGPFVLAIVLPGLGVNIANSIGGAVLGPELAAAYPGLSTAIGNTAMGTAFSGGDVASAVKSAAASYLGGTAGGFVGAGVTNATGLDLLGKVAASATSAAIAGGSVQNAVTTSLLQNGASAMTDYFDTSAGTTDQPIITGDIFGGDYSLPNQFDTGGIWDISTTPDYTPTPGGLFTGDIFGGDYSGDYGGDSGLFPPAAESPPADAFYIPIPDVQISPVPAPAGGGGNTLAQLTQAALAAVQLVTAYRNSGAQIQNPSAANRAASAASGTIITRTATGGVTSTRPPVGVATVTSDGGLIVNNGNGTFDYVSPTGQRSTRSYGGSGSPASTGGISLPGGVSTNTLLIGGAAVLALLLLKGK